jgi:hypothetical protein
VDDTELYWRPWIGHFFPYITPDRMERLFLHTVIEMRDFVKGD